MLPLTLHITQKDQLYFSHVNRLESLDEYQATETRAAVAWMSSADMRFAHITVPPLAQSLRIQAIAFEMEERLLVDVNALHFAVLASDTIAETTQELLHIACVSKHKVEQVLQSTSHHDLLLTAIYPDIFLLPWDTDEQPESAKVCAFIGADTLIVRTERYAGFSGDMSLLALLEHHIQQRNDETNGACEVELYVEHGAQLPESLANYSTHAMSLHQLINLATIPADHILQGHFAPTSPIILWLQSALPTLKPVLYVAALLVLSAVLGYAKRYKDTQAIEAATLNQVQQRVPEAGSDWRAYLAQQSAYYKNAQRPALPWRQFQALLPILRSCEQCKITSLEVNADSVVVTLLSNQEQAEFARQSIGKVIIDTSSDEQGNYSYTLRWQA